MTGSSFLGDFGVWIGPLALILGALWAFRYGARLGKNRTQKTQGLAPGVELEQIESSKKSFAEEAAAGLKSLSVSSEQESKLELEQVKERIRASLPLPPQIGGEVQQAETDPQQVETPTAPAPISMTVAKVRGSVPTAAETIDKIVPVQRPPLPAGGSVATHEESNIQGLEKFEDYAGMSSSKDELVGRSCRFLSTASRTGRVVFLEYSAQESSLRVSARSDAKVFAGTQPKLFVTEDVVEAIHNRKNLNEVLDYSKHLQRTLQDACLLEQPAGAKGGEAANRDFVMRTRDAWVMLPLFGAGKKFVGTFAVQVGDASKELGTAYRQIFSTLVGFKLAQLEQAQMVQEQITKDEATQVWTETEIKGRLEEALMTAQRLKHPLTVVHFEMDHWNLYLKRYGKEAGDALLRHTVRNLQRVFRRTDLIGKMGASGFCLLMPHTAVVDALKKLEGFIEVFAQSELRLKNADGGVFALRPFLNVGVAEYPSHAIKSEALLTQSLRAAQKLSGGRITSDNASRVALARAPQGYVAPFASRFVRSSSRPLLES